jgi:hypothetical protein
MVSRSFAGYIKVGHKQMKQFSARHLVAILLSAVSLTAAAENGSEYLGKDEDDFSSDCKIDYGVNWHASHDQKSGYLRFRHYICGEKKWMWLIYQAGIADPSRKRSQIVDVLDITSLRQSESIMQECSGGAFDDSVFVIGRKAISERGFNGKKIRAAWRVNQTTKKFEALPTKAIECGYYD